MTRCRHGKLATECRVCHAGPYGVLPPVFYLNPVPTPAQHFPAQPHHTKPDSLASIKKRFYQDRNLCSVCLQRSRAPNEARCRPCLKKKLQRQAARLQGG